MIYDADLSLTCTREFFGDNDTAQELVDNYSGKGEVKKENTESVTTDKIVGVYKDIDGNEIESNEIIIVTSKTGAHVYPGFPKKKGNKQLWNLKSYIIFF